APRGCCLRVHRRQHRDVRTTRLCRTLKPRSSVAAFASTASPSHVRDDHDTPLWPGRDACDVALILSSGKAKYFLFRGLTRIPIIGIDLPAVNLRRRVGSERAHRSSDHRDDFDLGIVVLGLTPRALDCNDHLLGRIDEDELAKGASRRKGAIVYAAWQ